MTSHGDQETPPPVSPVEAEATKAAMVAAVVEAVNNTPSGVPADLLTTADWEQLSKRDQRLLRGIFDRIARRETLVRDPAGFNGLRRQLPDRRVLDDEVVAVTLPGS